MLLAALFEESRAEHRALRESQRRYALAKAAAQEDERARIARNLHDSASQDLAALAIRLGVFQRDHTSPDPEQQRELTALRDRAIAIGEEIRQFAHELHPSILQRAGLPAAVAAHCEQFGADHRLQVDVACSTDTSGVPETVALCLYRACQEALHNVAKHAHATHVDVILTSTAHDVRLIVHDNGRGFDSRDRSGRTGIGLAGLDERLQQLDGTLVIDSSPGHGTTILATVPRGGA
jgi:two-component system sensor histidine kinase UhpB